MKNFNNTDVSSQMMLDEIQKKLSLCTCTSQHFLPWYFLKMNEYVQNKVVLPLLQGFNPAEPVVEKSVIL